MGRPHDAARTMTAGTAAALLDRLAAAAGRGAVRPRTEAANWRVAGVEPLAVVEPDSADAVAEVLAFCSAEGVPVEPAGAGSWLAAGAPPPRPPVILGTSRLDRITEHEPADLVIGFQAGVQLSALEAALRRHGQTLPLDPPAADGATAGALLALGEAGPLRAAHGRPRDLALGLEVVTGDGRLVRFGGRVVKNVAGYDAVRLLVGSGGGLAVITGAFMLVRSAPERDETRLVPCGADAADAAALALEVWRTVPCDALELLLPERVLAVRLRGSAAAVADAADRLARLHPGGAADAAPAATPASATSGAEVWDRLGRDEAAAALHLRLEALPGALADTLRAALEFVGAASGFPSGSTMNSASDDAFALPDGWRVAAHGANGIVRIWRAPDGPALDPERFAGAASTVAAQMASHGGTFRYSILPAALRGPATVPAAPAPGVLAIVERLRDAFDPGRILMPGRRAGWQ
jgi:glycolate oxidase FAD binding subunit